MFRPLLVAVLASACDPAECLDTYKDVNPSGGQNTMICPHPSQEIETENIKEGTFVRRVKVICRCPRGKK